MSSTLEALIPTSFEEFWDIIHPARKNPKPILPTSTCEVNEQGAKWKLNGVLHREGGPAVEYPDGYRAWLLNGKLHREGGPAIEFPNGYQVWYLNGVLQRTEDPT